METDNASSRHLSMRQYNHTSRYHYTLQTSTASDSTIIHKPFATATEYQYRNTSHHQNVSHSLSKCVTADTQSSSLASQRWKNLNCQINLSETSHPFWIHHRTMHCSKQQTHNSVPWSASSISTALWTSLHRSAFCYKTLDARVYWSFP